MTKALIAKPVVKNQFWIVTDGNEKVGNVIADGSGFEVKLNGGIAHFKNTNAITKQTHIEFERNVNAKVKQEIPFNEFPTTTKVYNSMLDIKRKLHLFTKTTNSKCYYAAGWFTLTQGNETTVEFCPKYIFIQRYAYQGPFKTKEEAENALNIR
jgi:hypothetical protein